VTKVALEYKDGTKTASLLLTWEQFKELYTSGKYEGKPIHKVSVEQKHSDKGPNTITFG
jgi:hypothetical protein